LRTQTKDADALIGPDHAIPAPEFELTRCRQAWRTRVPEELYPTSWITERTLATLRDCARGGRPFFIQCSYPNPIHPFTPPGKYWSLYFTRTRSGAAVVRRRHRALPSHVRWLHALRDAGQGGEETQALFACTEREAREAIALNYGSISLIDASVGRLLARAHTARPAEDTVVNLHQRSRRFSRRSPAAASRARSTNRGLVRTPFIWKDPATSNASRVRVARAIHRYGPTVLARAGVAAFNGIQGNLIAPAHAGEAETSATSS